MTWIIELIYGYTSTQFNQVKLSYVYYEIKTAPGKHSLKKCPASFRQPTAYAITQQLTRERKQTEKG